MSTRSIDEAPVPAQTPSAFTGSVWRGMLISLIPLGLLIIMVTFTVLLTALARLLFASSGFFVQQEAAMIVLIAGLALAVAVCVVALWRTLRNVRIWQQEGKRAQAIAALWGLGATALVVVVPILLALLLPQHPFP
jgi:hypothetical protein